MPHKGTYKKSGRPSVARKKAAARSEKNRNKKK